MAIAKVVYKSSAEATPVVWMDTTQKTVTAGSMLYGTTALKNDGTDITGTIASKTSSDLTANGLTVTAPAGHYASAASKTLTDNNLSAGNIKKDVSIFGVTGSYEGSGGGGLVYETGTWTPTEDVADATISFANSHTTAPLFVMICDSSTDNLTENSNYFSSLSDQYGFMGFAYVKGSNARYGTNVYGFASSTGLSGTFSGMSGQTSYNSYFSSLGFRAYGGATSRYWRSGRTYKWIAVWAPTT